MGYLMATIKQRLLKKNSSGTYDTVHLETDVSCITGILPVANGGTGASSLSSLKTALGTVSYGYGTNNTVGTVTIALSFTPLVCIACYGTSTSFTAAAVIKAGSTITLSKSGDYNLTLKLSGTALTFTTPAGYAALYSEYMLKGYMYFA